MGIKLKEKPFTSNRIYEGTVINLRVDCVEMDDGRKAVREVVEHQGAVGIVPVMDDGRIILVRQFRSAVGEEMLEIPAGTLKPGEDPAECAHRELIEETNHKAKLMEKLLFVYLAPGYSNEGMHIYLATGLSHCAGRQDEDEHVYVEIYSVPESLELISSGKIRDAKSVAGILLAQKLML